MTKSFGRTWLGTTEAAARLGVAPKTLYRMIDERLIPAYRMGRVIRLRSEDVDAFLDGTGVSSGDHEDLCPPPWDDDEEPDV